MSFRININENNKDTIIVRNAFSENGVYEFYYTGNIVEFTVPTSGTYKIEAWGAMGGGGTTLMGPKGAYSKSFVLLSKDERIKILVGEKGYPGYNSGDHIYFGGGGGGTFIAKDRTPLCVAGGGGSLTLYAYSTIQSHACGQSTQLSASIGSGRATLKMGGVAAHGSGGGGFEGNGEDGKHSPGKYGKGGISFINGGARQTSNTYGTNIAYGGFGGGASNYGNYGDGAGGGGYTGGSGSNSWYTQGGGGGSYFEGFYNNEVSEAISGCNESLPINPGTNGNGFAKLTLLKSIPSATVIKYETFSHCKIFMTWVFFATLLSQ
jgi:hypothetical protein